MRAHQFFFMAVLGLIPGPSSQADLSVITPTCDKNANVKFNPENCKAALKRVLYEPGNILDKVETHVEKASGSCVIVFSAKGKVSNPISKDSFELSINKILTQCKGTAGSIPHPSISGVAFRVRPRGKDPVYEEDFPAGKPACYEVADASKSLSGLKADCDVAYNAIFRYNDQFFSLDGYNPTNVARIIVGICQFRPATYLNIQKNDCSMQQAVWCHHFQHRGNRKKWKSIPEDCPRQQKVVLLFTGLQHPTKKALLTI
ncbi:hypothetical protein PGT21_032439 [Puccinia graminis f. sp. tritici]|uniref:Uncharacterized protein n=1 Tax=Puccinia graminis f. sp. tritici TaxID=56615 RepID=A0A5B0PE91_PUCGR|nr:hypothetical protein PGTUg99_015425 [Puccinia graminis f. sp. tritici]KAA1104824.1 hypothetical protein PGT21_032439 [Puccinia graminis f. sp. tritici]